jgi:predicted Zn-dependent protease
MKITLSLLVVAAVAFVACATSPTGRSQLILVPEAQMNAMGAQAFQELKSQTPTDSNPMLDTYVKCVALPITEIAKRSLDVKQWEIVVFKDETPNAFALPGGKIGVHTGILRVAKTPDQLATVLGHEVGHVIAKHGAERVSHGLVAQGGIVAADAFLKGQSSPAAHQAILAGLGLGVQVGVLLPYGRTQESEADVIGLDLMAHAGFDPRQSVELWMNMIAASGGKAPPQWLSTHPASENRIKSLQSRMEEAMATYRQARHSGKAPACQRPG